MVDLDRPLLALSLITSCTGRLPEPLSTSVAGSGKALMMLRPTGLSRFAGIRLPGNRLSIAVRIRRQWVVDDDGPALGIGQAREVAVPHRLRRDVDVVVLREPVAIAFAGHPEERLALDDRAAKPAAGGAPELRLGSRCRESG